MIKWLDMRTPKWLVIINHKATIMSSHFCHILGRHRSNIHMYFLCNESLGIREFYWQVWFSNLVKVFALVSQSVSHSQSSKCFVTKTKGKMSLSVQCWKAELQPDTVYYLSWLFISSSTLALPIQSFCLLKLGNILWEA